MYSQSFQIEGYTPAYAPEQPGKQQGQIHVADGVNFFWNLRGVQSGFGVTPRVTGAGPNPMRHPGCFLVKNQKFFFYENGVYQESGANWAPVFVYPVGQFTHPTYDLDAYKWTYAYVGTRHWFCHPLCGLIWYDEFDDLWGTFRDDCWNGPTFAITHADNRLVVMLQDVVHWSDFDRGDLHGDGFYTGAGCQSLALIRYGQPYTLMPYNTGWLSFTSKGVMSSRPIEDQVQHPDGRRVASGIIVFKHEEETFNDLPLGPTAITHVDEKQVLWLATQGFRQFTGTQGGGFGAVQAFEPLMGRFYKETIVPAAGEANAQAPDAFCLEYCADLNWLFVSSRESQLTRTYARAHVYQFELEKWGVWQQNHLHVASGRRDNEILAQTTGERHFGYLHSATLYSQIDPRLPQEHSWLRLSGVRLQIPNEDTLVETISALQGVRVGNARPQRETVFKGALESSFNRTSEAHLQPSIYKLLVSSGDDDAQALLDEQVYGQIVHRNHLTTHFAVHATGIIHSIIITALDQNEHFDIRHVEASFFWAGVK
jgi:hypothetical protein